MPETTEKKQDTRFKPGQSGNPAGRPKGSRNRVSEKLLETLAIRLRRPWQRGHREGQI